MSADVTPESPDTLRVAYEEGRAAAERGEEAAPGCTTTAEGRAWLRGYVDGAASAGAAAGDLPDPTDAPPGPGRPDPPR